MAKKTHSEPAVPGEGAPLHESVDRLAMEIRLLREVMDEMREDISWVTRNGLPHQSMEHFVVKQMALNPCARDWGDRLIVERHTNPPFSPLESGVLDQVAAGLKATFEAISQGQLVVVLTALDSVRSQLQSALKQPEDEDDLLNPVVLEAETPVPGPAPTAAREKPPKGRLF